MSFDARKWTYIIAAGSGLALLVQGAINSASIDDGFEIGTMGKIGKCVAGKLTAKIDSTKNIRWGDHSGIMTASRLGDHYSPPITIAFTPIFISDDRPMETLASIESKTPLSSKVADIYITKCLEEHGYTIVEHRPGGVVFHWPKYML